MTPRTEKGPNNTADWFDCPHCGAEVNFPRADEETSVDTWQRIPCPDCQKPCRVERVSYLIAKRQK